MESVGAGGGVGVGLESVAAESVSELESVPELESVSELESVLW